MFPIRQNQKWGYINRKGEIVIQPQFTQALFFSEGLAVACIEYDKCGYIDGTGKFAINPQFQRALRFSDGLAAVIVEDRVGYIDKTGKLAINPQFPSDSDFRLCTFSNDLARIKVGEKVGFIDKTGKIVINPQFEDASPFFDELAVAEIGSKYGFVDKDGKIVINPQFDDAQPFINGLAAVKVGKQYGYVDKAGKIAINPQFDKALPFSDEGLALVVLNNKIGFVDKSGKYEINPQFALQSIRFGTDIWQDAFTITSDIGRLSFSEGLAPAQVSAGKAGYVDKNGKFVINPQFDRAFPFLGGIAFIVSEDSPERETAWIDKEGKYIWREVKETPKPTPNMNANNANTTTTTVTSSNSVNTANMSGTTTTNTNTSTSNSASNERTGRLTTDMNLRSDPNKDAASVGIHFRGAKVRILDETSYVSEGQTSTWYKVKVYEYGCSANANLGCGKNSPNDGEEGWVNAKLVLLN
ncbi:MAG: WG repeat-containing protein [Pyrinomonadaceae bacterium]